MTSASQLLQNHQYSLGSQRVLASLRACPSLSTPSSCTPSACTFDVMTGYGTTGTTGNQHTGTTGTRPVQNDQGGYLGQAQGWATRVTGNLQGQLGEMKGKVVGNQGSTGTAAGTGTGYHPTGTGTGYGATNTGMNHNAPGNPPYSDANTGHNPNVGFGNQTQPAHQTQPMSQGYAPTQAKTGSTAGGTYGSTAAKPSYTDQAKQYTAKGADMLHGQAEYLKSKLVGTQGTGAAATNSGYGQGSGTGHNQTGRAGDPMQTVGGAPQGKKSWTESAKQGLATGLTYTQQGLEVVKNKVGGPATPGTTGTGGTSYSTGPSTNSTAGAQPGYNAGSQHGYGAGVQPGHNAGSQAGYNAGSQPGYSAGSQPGHNAGAQPGYNAGAQPGYNSGTNTHQKY